MEIYKIGTNIPGVTLPTVVYNDSAPYQTPLLERINATEEELIEFLLSGAGGLCNILYNNPPLQVKSYMEKYPNVRIGMYPPTDGVDIYQPSEPVFVRGVTTFTLEEPVYISGKYLRNKAGVAMYDNSQSIIEGYKRVVEFSKFDFGEDYGDDEYDNPFSLYNYHNALYRLPEGFRTSDNFMFQIPVLFVNSEYKNLRMDAISVRSVNNVLTFARNYEFYDDWGIGDEDIVIEGDSGGEAPQYSGCAVDLSERFSPRLAYSGKGAYVLTTENLEDFMQGLWSVGFSEKFQKSINGEPVDNILSLKWFYGLRDSISTNMLKSYLTLGSTAFDGTWGNSSVKTQTLYSEYAMFSCGVIDAPVKFNNFLDYSPYTKYHMFIPFVGFVELDSSEIAGHRVELVYSIDLFSGSAIASVNVLKSSGGCRRLLTRACTVGKDDPFNVQSTESLQSRVATSIAGVGGMAITTALPNPITASIAAAGVSNHIDPSNWTGGTTSRSGGLSADTATLDDFTARLYIERPIPIVPDNYDLLIGRPDYRSGTMQALKTSYMKISAVRNWNAAAFIPKEAYDEIETLLRGGVYYE